MKLCNDTITVFNATVSNGVKVWHPTVIQGVSWFSTDASTVDSSKGGLVAAKKVTIRIPAELGGAYTDPISYKNAVDVSNIWTLTDGDIVVKATVTGDGWTPSTLHNAYTDCAVILGVTDNRRAPNAPHWRVTAG